MNESEVNPAILSEEEQNEQIAQRKSKLIHLRARGNAYPNDFNRNHLALELHEKYSAEKPEDLESQKIHVKIAGRMMTRRVMGKASFAHIQDMSRKIQLYISRDAVSEALYEEFKTWDLGDILGVEGSLFKTKTGELSVRVERLYLLTKSLRPWPNKFHGLHDQEQRFRQRYLDLLVNEDSRRIFQIRSKLISKLRSFFDGKKFVEVETPMMHVQPGGATARPFVTHHNALDMELYLRVAPELYLKRLVVGGIEKVYEVNRNFRNEGVSTRHNPEFTMLEFYQAYATYQDAMNLTEELMHYLAQQLFNSSKLTYQGVEIDFAKAFARIPLKQAILKFNSQIKPEQLEDFASAKKLAAQYGIETKWNMRLGKIQFELFEKLVEPHLQQPTFITHFPKEISPLARSNDQDEFLADRFEFYVGGQEIANGFSELNDPEEQAKRFEEQIAAREAGDMEAMSFDQDYISALEYGLPPTVGEGIGVDRLAMLFADCDSIRDVILFPLLKPKS